LRRRDRHVPGRIGCKMPEDTALTYSPRSRQSTTVLPPGEDAVCRACPGRGACTDMANFTGPVPVDGNVAVVAQIVAFTDDQLMELLMKAEKAS